MCGISCKCWTFLILLGAVLASQAYFYGNEQRIRFSITSDTNQDTTNQGKKNAHQYQNIGTLATIPNSFFVADYWIVIIFFVLLILFMDAVIGCCRESERLGNVQAQNRKLKSHYTELSQAYLKLQKICEKVEIMIPYNLNNVIQKNVVEASNIPNLKYFPMQQNKNYNDSQQPSLSGLNNQMGNIIYPNNASK